MIKMQLTKDDLIDNEETGAEGIDLITFKQVVEFYEKYRKDPEKFLEEQKDLCKVLEFDQSCIDTLMSDEWRDWLFVYCFKDGLK